MVLESRRMENDDCIATAYFRSPIKCNEQQSTDKVPIRLQVIHACGVLSVDIAFLSNFLSHQGASSKYCCPHCLAKLADMKNTFLPVGECQCEPAARRSLASIKAAADIFDRLFTKNAKRDKALRTNITQNHSFSIAGFLMADDH